jgi:hypothetical protein
LQPKTDCFALLPINSGADRKCFGDRRQRAGSDHQNVWSELRPDTLHRLAWSNFTEKNLLTAFKSCACATFCRAGGLANASRPRNKFRDRSPFFGAILLLGDSI